MSDEFSCHNECLDIGVQMRLMADAACGHVTDLSAIVPPPCTACAARWFIATIAARLREGR